MLFFTSVNFCNFEAFKYISLLFSPDNQCEDDEQNAYDDGEPGKLFILGEIVKVLIYSYERISHIDTHASFLGVLLYIPSH